MCGPRGLPGAKNILYHKQRRRYVRRRHYQGAYRFAPTGITRSAFPRWIFDEDGWPDIFIPCDSTPSILYRNNHDGTFTDVAVTAGAGVQ